MAEERLQKILAHGGFGSRRHCEELITAGRVLLNGRKPQLGEKADAALDKIEVDFVPMMRFEALCYVALNKPRGIECTLAPQNDRTGVRALVNLPGRLYPVGRLDADSEGLVLMTNDGALTNALTHPRYGHEKEYHVLLDRIPDAQQLATWRRGLVLEGGDHTLPAEVETMYESSSGSWVKVVLREGRKHQIRRVALALGLTVRRLQRVRLGTLQLGRLAPGEWRLLNKSEIEVLQRSAPSKPKSRSRPAPAPADKSAATQAQRGSRPAGPAKARSQSAPASAAKPAARQAQRGSRPAGPAKARSQPAPASAAKPAARQAQRGSRPAGPVRKPRAR